MVNYVSRIGGYYLCIDQNGSNPISDMFCRRGYNYCKQGSYMLELGKEYYVTIVVVEFETHGDATVSLDLNYT